MGVPPWLWKPPKINGISWISPGLSIPFGVNEMPIPPFRPEGDVPNWNPKKCAPPRSMLVLVCNPIYITITIVTIWLFNIAMENPHF